MAVNLICRPPRISDSANAVLRIGGLTVGPVQLGLVASKTVGYRFTVTEKKKAR